MDRYAVVVVDRQTGEADTLVIFTGEEGADQAHGKAAGINQKSEQLRAIVVGLL